MLLHTSRLLELQLMEKLSLRSWAKISSCKKVILLRQTCWMSSSMTKVLMYALNRTKVSVLTVSVTSHTVNGLELEVTKGLISKLAQCYLNKLEFLTAKLNPNLFLLLKPKRRRMLPFQLPTSHALTTQDYWSHLPSWWLLSLSQLVFLLKRLRI